MPPSSASNSSWVPTSATLPSATLAQLGAWSSDLPAEKSNQLTEKHHSVGSMLGLANQMQLFSPFGRLARDVNVVRHRAPSGPIWSYGFRVRSGCLIPAAGGPSGIYISLSSQRTQWDFCLPMPVGMKVVPSRMRQSLCVTWRSLRVQNLCWHTKTHHGRPNHFVFAVARRHLKDAKNAKVAAMCFAICGMRVRSIISCND